MSCNGVVLLDDRSNFRQSVAHKGFLQSLCNVITYPYNTVAYIQVVERITRYCLIWKNAKKITTRGKIPCHDSQGLQNDAPTSSENT